MLNCQIVFQLRDDYMQRETMTAIVLWRRGAFVSRSFCQRVESAQRLTWWTNKGRAFRATPRSRFSFTEEACRVSAVLRQNKGAHSQRDNGQ